MIVDSAVRLNPLNYQALLALFILNFVPFAYADLDLENIRLKSLINWSQELLVEATNPITVAIIDTGLQTDVSSFRGKLLPGMNFLERGMPVVDDEGHGSACAGIILELSSKNTLILPIRVAGRTEQSTNEIFEEAFIYAYNQGAEIINLSMSLTEKMLNKVLNRVGIIRFKQTLIVVAAGNTGEEFDDLREEWDNVIVVGALNLTYPIEKAKYSNFGERVDLMAPAGNSHDGITTVAIGGPDRLRLFNGTSAAAPVVAGVAALLKETWPLLTAVELKKMLLDRSCNTPALAGLSRLGSSLNVAQECP
jgi:subtilisin family serine protease